MIDLLRSHLALAPVLVPFVAGVLGLLLGRWALAVRTIGTVAAGFQLVAAALLAHAVWRTGVVVVEIGGWPAPYGIAVAVDPLSALMVVLTAVVGAAGLLYALAHAHVRIEEAPVFVFFQFLLVGVNGSFVTADLFNLFVWFEVTLMASYALVSIGATAYQLREGVTYMAINMFGSAMFLVGLALVYRITGTLNMADLALKVRALEDGTALSAVSLVLLFVFAGKAGLFPLFFWLPRPYDASPSEVTPIFAALLTKVGVYALLRGFGMIFVGHPSVTHALILGLAAVTMIVGALGAVAEREPKRALGFAVVAQVAFAVAGLGLGTREGLVAAVYLVVHDVVVLPALFVAVAFVERRYGRGETPPGGLVRRHPGLAALFLAAAVSLAGAPPWSGFFGKLTLLEALYDAERGWLVAVSLVASLLTLVAMVRLFVAIFWGEARADVAPRGTERPLGAATAWPLAALVGLSLALGVGARAVLVVAGAAADGLLDPAAYVSRVLGE